MGVQGHPSSWEMGGDPPIGHGVQARSLEAMRASSQQQVALPTLQVRLTPETGPHSE